MWFLFALLACQTDAAAGSKNEDPPAAASERAPDDTTAVEVTGRWAERCGENDAVIAELAAEVDGLELAAFASTLRPGLGPWTVQPAEGRVAYPPEKPMVSLDGKFVTSGTIEEVEHGLVLSLDGHPPLVVNATWTPLPDGARCE